MLVVPKLEREVELFWESRVIRKWVLHVGYDVKLS